MRVHFANFFCFFVFLSCIAHAQIITTIAGNGSTGNSSYVGDGGPALGAEVWYPEDVCTDQKGNIYIIDYGNGRIRKVDTSSGIITTYAGGGPNYFGDGGPATAVRVGECFAITCDSLNNLFISDINSSIRKVNTGDTITTVAGNRTTGYSGDGGPATAAEVYWPAGLAVDKSGNIYISDTQNHRIRKVSTSGIISTFAGTGVQGNTGDGGPALSAQFNYPCGIAFDTLGNLYVTDGGNNRIRKINTSGIITNVAGDGTQGYGGDGGPATSAQLRSPHDVATDRFGNFYIADTGNNRIRKVSASGTITTFAGNGAGGFSGDGGVATAAQIAGPRGVAVDATSTNMYIADEGNSRVRRVTIPCSTPVINISGADSICPGGYTILHGSGATSYTWTPGSVNTPSLSVAPITNTIYTLTAATGTCTATQTFSVAIHPTVSAFVTHVNPDTICEGSSGVISISGLPSNTSYTWSAVPNAGLGGGFGFYAIVTPPYAGSADTTFTYYVSIDVPGPACLANHPITVTVGSCVGIEAFANAGYATIFPNPTDGKFRIQTNSTETQRLQLSDINGRLILNRSISTGAEIDVSNLDNGIYYLSLRSEDKIFNQKLIIAR